MGRFDRVRATLNRIGPALAGAAWLTATAAMAQTAPPTTTVAPLTVQGAPPPKVVEKQSKSFVQSSRRPPPSSTSSPVGATRSASWSPA